MVEIKNGRGLCTTCNNAPTCFHRARRGPALFCELFDNYMPPDMQISDRMTAPVAEPSIAVRAVEEEVTRYAGLCMNCDHRKTCRHPKPAGGVWHCEDYR